jgi:O-antigen/teichoic acid export membrane protein
MYLEYSIKYFLILALPAVVGLSILSKPLLEILSNHEIAENAFNITPYVAVSTLLYGFIVIVSEIIFLSKKTAVIAYSWMLGGAINIGLNILLIPKFGIVAAAITTLISYVVIFIVIVNKSRKYVKFKVSLGLFVKALFNSLLMGVVLYFLPHQKIEDILLSIVLVMIIYFTISFVSGVFTKKELLFLKSLIRKNQ